MKTIKVYLEIPEKLIDIDSPFLSFSANMREAVYKILKTAIVEQYLNKIKIPEIEITKEEIKDQMMTILAERALEGRGE